MITTKEWLISHSFVVSIKLFRYRVPIVVKVRIVDVIV